jgi:tetratricopeptide (TPR) repeat protein
MSARWLPALLLAGTAALPAPLSWLHPHLPSWAERWLYNPRERTAAAIAASRLGDAGAAADRADTALRLAGTEPRVRYNAGTAHLSAGRSDAAALLEQAAKDAPRELTADASYNLGNARLAAGDAAGAAEAYKQALRAFPGDLDAKYNLELALRRRERDRLRTRSPREGPKGDRRGGRDSSAGTGSDSPADRQRQPGPSDPGRSPQQGQGPSNGQPQNRPAQPSPWTQAQPLPGYQDQPDLSAREAASLLQAIENLERQQRREAAARISRERAAKGKDW